jgi:hypothetical protein
MVGSSGAGAAMMLDLLAAGKQNLLIAKRYDGDEPLSTPV